MEEKGIYVSLFVGCKQKPKKIMWGRAERRRG